MAAEAAITEEQLRAIVPLLDQLNLGFVLVGGDGELALSSYGVRNFLGRRPTTTKLRALLGEAWELVVAAVLAGHSAGARWREVASPDGELHASVRSTAVALTAGGTGALVTLFDVSHEIGLHLRYKAAMAQLEETNEGLRRRVAEVLREHEDDVAQFEELLQVAPAIFASFVGEAGESVDALARMLRRGELDRAALDDSLRTTHTLKGNARGLGLHFIAGRAHAVEDLLIQVRDRHHLDPQELDAAVGDLRRAVERAAGLRGRLTPASASAGLDTARTVEAATRQLATARAHLAPGSPARLALDGALAALTPLARVPLGELFAYLRVTAQAAAEASGKPAPDVEVSGDDLAVAPAVHAALSRALPHLVKNAVIHGLEPAAERAAAGKAAAGRITLAARAEGDRLRLRLRDDGRGLDRVGLRARADALGLALGPPADDGVDPVDALIFHPGLSTAAEVGLDAGRGYGTSAAHEAITALGGTIAVRSHPGAGVDLELLVPAAP